MILGVFPPTPSERVSAVDVSFVGEQQFIVSKIVVKTGRRASCQKFTEEQGARSLFKRKRERAADEAKQYQWKGEL